MEAKINEELAPFVRAYAAEQKLTIKEAVNGLIRIGVNRRLNRQNSVAGAADKKRPAPGRKSRVNGAKNGAK